MFKEECKVRYPRYYPYRILRLFLSNAKLQLNTALGLVRWRTTFPADLKMAPIFKFFILDEIFCLFLCEN